MLGRTKLRADRASPRTRLVRSLGACRPRRASPRPCRTPRVASLEAELSRRWVERSRAFATAANDRLAQQFRAAPGEELDLGPEPADTRHELAARVLRV